MINDLFVLKSLGNKQMMGLGREITHGSGAVRKTSNYYLKISHVSDLIMRRHDSQSVVKVLYSQGVWY